MTFETKEQVLERILTRPKPNCPHCSEEMSLWEVPPVNVGDGLGWGPPICISALTTVVPATSRAGIR